MKDDFGKITATSDSASVREILSDIDSKNSSLFIN